MNEPPSAKVRRWKLSLQEYDFQTEHIAGTKNLVADSFSRMFDIPIDIVAATKEEPTEEELLGLHMCHGERAGHGGIERTVKALAHNNYMVSRTHVKAFIKKCICCQKMSAIKPAITTHKYVLHRYNPWERVYMDALSIGQPDLEGYMHVLVLIDSFSRWLEMFPLKTLEAKETVEHLIEHFGRFGEPDEIVTDNGMEFINEIVRNLVELAGIDHIRTTSYSHEENGMVQGDTETLEE
jgi:hypothetical protein